MEQVTRPMLARLERELPRGGYLYEPKWDGFRCLATRDGDEIDLRSRNRDWVPVAPELVCEVQFDQLDDHRFRHPARFRRWRPDRDPRSCTLDQLA